MATKQLLSGALNLDELDGGGVVISTRRTVWVKVWLAVAALLLAVTVALPSQASPTVTGDQTAWREVTAALNKVAATSYRMRMTAPGQTVITEHAPPDATRMTMQIAGESGEIEWVIVGTETRSRVTAPPGAPGPWICSGPSPQPWGIDLKGYFTVVEVSRRPDAVIAGAPVHAYHLIYTIQGSGQSGKSETTLYIGAQTGLPRRSVTPYPLAAGGTIVIDYYDYGAPITITLPACS